MSTVTFDAVTKRYPNGFEAVTDLNLDVVDGELLVVVGPSGCGKTTTLRMLAGLETITKGDISIGDQRVNSVAPRNRDIAMVFQSYALYPHLTVGQNLGYPLKLAGNSKSSIKEQVGTVARQLRLVELLDRKPRQLSGGQRQRVAMGRAMVRQPRVFLMDEPLSNLDARLRVSMRAEVAELQQSLGTTMFYVTHDQIEAMTLGHRVAVMDDGVLQQCAPPVELYRNPANTFVATFIGAPPMNLINANVTSTEQGYELASGTDRCHLDASPTKLQEGDFILGFRPEHVRFHSADDGGLAAVVRMVEHLGSEHVVHLDLVDADVVETRNELASDSDQPAKPLVLAKIADPETSMSIGDVVRISVEPVKLHFFDSESGLAVTA